MDTSKYQSLLIEKKDELEKRIKSIQDDKTRKNGPLDPDSEEQANMLQNNEVVDHLDELERKELEDVVNALSRIENKTFGQCTLCGNEISEKRLDALPTTNICISCLDQ